jgi:hypothetical protein
MASAYLCAIQKVENFRCVNNAAEHGERAVKLNADCRISGRKDPI